MLRTLFVVLMMTMLTMITIIFNRHFNLNFCKNVYPPCKTAHSIRFLCFLILFLTGPLNKMEDEQHSQCMWLRFLVKLLQGYHCHANGGIVVVTEFY